jgi:hypothetical protein
MSWDGFAERRATQRVTLEDSNVSRLAIRARVILLDISTIGALIASDTALPVGARGELNAMLPTGRFSTALEVRRAHPQGEVRARQFGTVFKTMDERSRALLESLLRRAADC